MRKADVETHYEHGESRPAVNVKHHLWFPDLFRAYEGVRATSQHICVRCGQSKGANIHHGTCRFKPGGSYFVHEYGDDAGFWAWMHEVYDDDSCTSSIDAADEWAREGCWEQAIELAHEIWPEWSTEMVDEKKFFPEFPPGCQYRFTGKKVGRKRYHVQVYSEGRSGGWCVVHGLPEIEEWDAIALGRWARFEKGVKLIADEEYPYQFVWNLAVNVFEPIREERRNAYPAPAYT